MHTLDQIVYQSLASAAGQSFEELHAIFAMCLPSREQKSRDKIAAMCDREDYKVLIAKQRGKIIGFSIVFAPPLESFCLLEYLAVHPDERGSGIGRQLFRESVTASGANTRGIAMLIEVDSDRERSADHEIRRRRQQFYRKLGCLRIEGLSYALPLNGVGPPPEMDLMVFCPEALLPIRKSRLQHWLIALYEGVYDCPSDDPRIVEMLGPVDDPIELA